MEFKFLDAANPQSQGQFTQALQHEAAAGFAPYIGGNNTQQNRNWPLALIEALTAEGYEAAPIWVPWPATANGTADGQSAAAIAHAVGAALVFNDLEAGTGQPASQPQAPAYSAAWRDAIHAAGLLAGGYSNATGIQRNFAGYDRVWCATQGLADACNIAFHCPGGPGQRAAQCSNGGWAGVSYDVNFAEYTFGGLDMAQLDEILNYVVALYQGDPSKPDCSTTQLKAAVTAIEAQLAALPLAGGLTAAQAGQLADIQARVAAIEAALKSA
jgi:hypothetical protein